MITHEKPDEITKPTAVLSWSLYATCPHCNETMDLADIDDDNAVPSALFTNRWGDLADYEVACRGCSRYFEIEGVEY